MGLKFNVIKFSIDVEDSKYTCVVSDKVFDEELSRLIESADSLTGDVNSYDEVVKIVSQFTDLTFGEGAFDMMTKGFDKDYQIAMQLINFIFTERAKYVKEVLQEFEVPKAEMSVANRMPIVDNV